ncbi:MAG: anion transporter [Methanoregula sp.]|nr:anion transporter [Methanoregula sp.]
MYIPIIVLAAVFVLITIRQIGRYNLKIWQIMLGGAVAVLVTGQLPLPDALAAINIDVMLFLFGMFIVGVAMVESGYLSSLSRRFFSYARTPDQMIFFLLFGIGFLSALLMNDTLAIIGTPLVLGLATQFRISPKLMLLSLAIAITTGSVMSPIGNPQNLLIAVDSGMETPFVTFSLYLLIPSLISLGVAFMLLRFYFRPDFSTRVLDHDPILPVDKKKVFPVKCSLAIILVLAAANIIASLYGGKILVPLPFIALCAAVPVILLGTDRVRLLKNIDWFTLVFFAAMFVLMESVWQTGFFQSFVDQGMVTSIPMILLTSASISQFISNVPFVALFQPMILQAGGTTAQLMALAAGSTIAGNLTILGAASNVIIIQNAEKQGETLTFFEFAKVGVPLTVLQLVVYWVGLVLLPF